MSEHHGPKSHAGWSVAPCLIACLALLAAPPSTFAKGKPGGGGTTDTTPPAAVQDLRVTFHDDELIDIAWTATADDGADLASGAATEYDIRVLADELLTDQNWSSARQSSCSTWGSGPPAPRTPGSAESLELTYFRPGGTYSIGMKVADEAGNWSTLSNVEWFSMAVVDWVVERVDIVEQTRATACDIAFDGTGQPARVYRVGDSASNGQLYYARLEGGAWQTEPFGPVGAGCGSLAFDAAGEPAVAYLLSGVVELARRQGGVWTVETVDDWGAGAVAASPSLAFDGDEQPAIAWFGAKRRRGAYDYELRLARRDDAGWGSETVEQVSVIGLHGECTLVFVDGQPWIGHTDSHGGTVLDSVELKRWDGTTWQSETVDEFPDSSGFSGGECQLALLPGDIPCFSYLGEPTGSGPEVRYAEQSPGGAWDITIVATNYETHVPLLAVDASGTPAILHVSGFCDAPLKLSRPQPDGSWLPTDVVNMPAPAGLVFALGPGPDQAAFLGNGYWESLVYGEQVVSP